MKHSFKSLQEEHKQLRRELLEQEEALARQWVFFYNHSGELFWNTFLDLSKGLGKSLWKVVFTQKRPSTFLYKVLFSVAQFWLLKKISTRKKRSQSQVVQA
ncbi:MAG: hypothetical protein K6T34_07200 [Thermoflavifilum sp.]|nr:hypothetical protein [Thermoflavifilum sp.]